MKKWILRFSLFTAALTPIVTVVSCGRTKVIEKQESKIVAQIGIDQSQEFSSIPIDGITWNGGVAFHSSAQGVSYLMNIARELGWSEPGDKLDFENSNADLVTANKIKTALAGLTILPTPITPAKEFWIDPVGSDGSMDPWWFTQATTHLGFDLGNTKDENNSKNSFGLNTGDGKFVNLGRIDKYQARLDARRPGSTIIRAWITGLDKNQYVKTWHSNENVVRTYPKATSIQIEEITKLVVESISNLKATIQPEALGLLQIFVNDSFASLINWMLSSEMTEEKVKNAVIKLNGYENVAHHIDAIIGFLKGWKNIPVEEQPWKASSGDLQGLSSVTNVMDLIYWFRMTPNQHNYTKAVSA